MRKNQAIGHFAPLRRRSGTKEIIKKIPKKTPKTKRISRTSKTNPGESKVQPSNLHKNMNLQNFMAEMQMIGTQTRNISKPTFNYGQLEISNYLLWLILFQLTINNNIEVNKTFL